MWKTIKRALSGSGPQQPPQTGPLGLVLGGAWSADLFAVRAHGERFRFEFSDSSAVIVAAGHADLGDGVTLYRYYDDDDQMLQVLAGSDAVEDVREITLFQPFDSIVPGSAAAWQAWTGQDGWMRAPSFELDDGTRYERAWFTDTPGPAELVEFVEYIRSSRDEAVGRRVAQSCMLYTREIPGAEDLYEHLLVIKEETGAGEAIELMVGIDLRESQLKVF